MTHTDTTTFDSLSKSAGYLAVSGALIMLAGAICWGMTGADIFTSLRDGTMNTYLEQAALSRTLYVANTCCWIIGVSLMGLAGILMASASPLAISSKAAIMCFRIAVPLAIVSFITMLAVIIQIAPDTSDHALLTAKVVGWVGAMGDDIATLTIVGLGPFFITRTAGSTWAPRWLVVWGSLAGLIGIFYFFCLLIPSIYSFAFIMVPVGIFWMIAAGIVLIRRK